MASWISTSRSILLTHLYSTPVLLLISDVESFAYNCSLQDVNFSFTPPYDEVLLSAQTKELLCYLWDNYLETYAVDQIVLMGVGDSYCGIKDLLTSRDCRPKIACVLSFVQGMCNRLYINAPSSIPTKIPLTHLFFSV